MQPPVKHVVQAIQVGMAMGNVTIPVAVGTLNPDPYTNTTNIKNANKIYSVELQIDWCPQQNAVVGDYFLDMYLAFNINGAQPMPVATGTGASHINNQIFWEEGCSQVVGAVTQSSVPHVWRTRVSLPRSWHTFNEGDSLELHLTNTGPAGGFVDFKYKIIYKEVFP